MSRRPLLAAAVAAVALVAAAGCGVPGRTNVVVDGRSRAVDTDTFFGGEDLPPGPEGVGNNTEEFVSRFLQAPAGDFDSAAARVKKFLDPQLRESWQVPREITVVRLVSGKPDIKPPPNTDVVLNVQQIGVLTSRGTLDPPTSQTTQYRFSVGPQDAPGSGGGLVVTNPPPVMLLTDTALARWYEQRPIYFWDTDQRNLVPDLRYLPNAVEDAARPNLLISWLIGGPVNWLRPSVLELPDGTEQLRNAYKDSGRLIVNLNDAVTGQNQNLDHLLAQLCWTLRNDFSGDVVLQIESRQRLEGSALDYVEDSPEYRLTNRDDSPETFAVAGGAVRRLQLPGQQVPPDVPVVDATVNKNVRYAAISQGAAALVRTEGDRLRLWVGPDQNGHFQATSLIAGTMGRPVLADGQDEGYVAAAGKLYQFSRTKRDVTQVTASGLPGGVTSVALAPDGRRLAVVAGGRPYLVALGGDAEASSGITRPVPVTLSDLTGISWLSETSLAMTGLSRDQVALVKTSLDGAVLASAPQELSSLSVAQLVSFPQNPKSGAGGPILIEADQRIYQVYTTSLQLLEGKDLAGQPVKGIVPTAPFFLE